MSSTFFPIGRVSDCLVRDIEYIEQVSDTVQAELSDAVMSSTILEMLFASAPPSHRITQEIAVMASGCYKESYSAMRWLWGWHDFCKQEELRTGHQFCPSVLSVIQFGDAHPAQVRVRGVEMSGTVTVPDWVPAESLPTIAGVYALWNTETREQKHLVFVDDESNLWCRGILIYPYTRFNHWIVDGSQNEAMQRLERETAQCWDLTGKNENARGTTADRLLQELRSPAVWQKNYLKFARDCE